MAISRVADVVPEKMVVTVLDIRSGNDVNTLAKELYFPYQSPIEGQEYLAVKVQIDVVEADFNKVYYLYSDWHFSLRYAEGGSDIYPENYGRLLTKGYPPLSGTAWIYFLIRKDSRPLLYFQPNLSIAEGFGYRTSGAYFSLGNS